MYKCDNCSRTFARHSALRNHSRTHIAEHIDEQIRIATKKINRNNINNYIKRDLNLRVKYTTFNRNLWVRFL